MHFILEKIFEPSVLQKIQNFELLNKHAFEESSIRNISIPSSVTKIGENVFFDCENLQNVQIPIDSELKIIESNVFSITSIISITIPYHVIKICDNAFKYKNQITIP